MTDPVLNHLTMTTDLIGKLLREGIIDGHQQVKVMNSNGRWHNTTINALRDKSRLLIFKALQDEHLQESGSHEIQ